MKIPFVVILLAVACASPKRAEVPAQENPTRPARDRALYHLENIEATVLAKSLNELLENPFGDERPLGHVDVDPDSNTLLLWMRDPAHLPELIALVTHLDRPRPEQ